LTHSMEVALIAKALARKFGADADLCEAVAIGHDLGHPPFGHNGESVLNACMRQNGGFEGNAQTLRIVRRLEVKGHRYAGLNLTFATLDGILKYKTPFSDASTKAGDGSSLTKQGGVYGLDSASDDARDLRERPSAPKCVYDDDWNLVQTVTAARGTEGDESFECRVLNLADDIAYCVADIQDGFAMGFLGVQSLREAAAGGGFIEEVSEFLCARDPSWSEFEVQRWLGEFVSLYDAIASKGARGLRGRALAEASRTATSKELGSKLHREFVEHVTVTPDGRPDLSEEKCRKIAVLKAVTRTQILKDPRLTTLDAAARKVVKRLFEAFANDPELLPRHVAERMRAAEGDSDRLRLVCDHVAAMTDDGALSAYRRLYEPGSKGLLDFV
jgi:dGTPase